MNAHGPRVVFPSTKMPVISFAQMSQIMLKSLLEANIRMPF
jgi:hypothetical protein